MYTTALQIVLNSLIAGLVLSLVAIGFTYIFRVTRVFHIAHGGIYTAGAFATWWGLNITSNWLIAVLTGLLVAIFLAYAIEAAIYLPMSKRSSNQVVSMVASMGSYVVIVNCLALTFGNEVETFGSPFVGSVQLIGTTLTYVQLVQCVVALVIVMVAMYLGSSRRALPLRALADNDLAARVLGINTDKERKRVLIAGSILAAIAALLRTLDVGIEPQGGMSVTLAAAVVTILVSRLNVFLIVAFAVALTLLQNVVEFFSNAQWRDAITFALLLVVILFRTEGIISYKLRRDTA